MESGSPSSLIVLVSSVATGVSLTGSTNIDTGAGPGVRPRACDRFDRTEGAMVRIRDDKKGQVVPVLVGGAQGDRLGGVLVGAHDRLGLGLRSLLRRLEVRDEVGDVAIGAAQVPGEARIVGNGVAVLVSPMVEYQR